MEQNLILAGVGGQGILTIARAICVAALRRGMQIKQAEVHGMSQRGGAVQSHLRIADHEIFSDLIPAGKADAVIAVEPLESLRYIQYLSTQGALVTGTNPVVNIENYPPVEDTLDRIAAFPRHAMIDADRLARAAGSARAANAVMLGAASPFLQFDPDDLCDALAEIFQSRGKDLVELNQRAFRFGRNAAVAYCDALHRGATSRSVRHWIETVPAEHLAAAEKLEDPALDVAPAGEGLTGAEMHAIRRMLEHVREHEREQLFEHEVYTLVQLVGAITPPRYIFVPANDTPDAEELKRFGGDQVVLKLVSPDVVHKTEARGLAFVRNDFDTIKRETARLMARHEKARIEGVLIVEYVERTQPGFGNELFVGIRATREFGPVIAAGLGGINTEYMAGKMRPGIAVAKAVASDTTPEQFLDLFKRTAAYDFLSGRVRGHDRIVPDGELLRCFRAFLSIAREFCPPRGDGTPTIEELEVNPFAFRQQHMVPLDGRGRLGTLTPADALRPLENVERLLEPRTIAILGVSGQSMNFGRIILNNILKCGFAPDKLTVIKDGEREIDGARCVPTIDALPEAADLLVIASAAAGLPDVLDQVVASEKAHSCILIPGGVGETEGSDELRARVHASIRAARKLVGGPVFLGPNCLGVQSRPGGYDTFFIPEHKLDTRWTQPARRCALISQSGAFVISRLSNLECLDPALAISYGNQLDVTLSDLITVVGRRDDIDVIGVYAEGFNNLDGLAVLRAIERVTADGKIVLFYKAGRTDSGRSAAAGHTTAVAGDYDVCQAAAAQAGAIVVDTFKEFEQLLEISTALHDKRVNGRHIAAITNAGCEAVAMADAIRGPRYTVEMPELSAASVERLSATLAKHKLDKLVNPRNPIDLTPMAGDDAYEDVARVLVNCDEIDALVVATIPLTGQMLTTPDEIAKPGSLVDRLPKLFREAAKPVIFVVDSGHLYDPLAQAVRQAGVPTLRSCDQAIRSLGRYLCHRAPTPAPTAVKRPTVPPASDALPLAGVTPSSV